MREIEFRAYVLGKMYYNVELNNTKYGLLICTTGGFYCIDSGLSQDDNAHVMQYTGLRDKNGVKIYEGDIVVDFFDDLCEVKCGDYHNGACYSEDAYWGVGFYTISLDGKEETIRPLTEEDIKVVGNIHDKE